MAASKAFRFGAAFAAFGMVLSSTAHAAPSALSGDPLVSLSVFGTSSSRAAVCGTGGAAATAAGTAGQSGSSCALPFLGAAASAAAAQQTVDYTPVAPQRPFFAALAPAFGVFALGVLIIFLIDDDDGDSSISPG